MIHSFHGLSDGNEHLLIEFSGQARSAEAPLVRLHSECLTGDVLGSMRCDCGAQLTEAVTLMAGSGGILLYLRQEGRGIGLYNKLDAYRLQDQGLDTFAANRALDRGDDERDYAAAVAMLKALGIENVRLLTNNPDKVYQLQQYGIHVEQVIQTGRYETSENEQYLRDKSEIAHHAL